MANTYKICFIGAAGTGKSTFVERMLTGEFTTRYVPTIGVEVHPLRLRTNYGEVILNIWDTAGDPKLRGLADGYYVQSDAAVIFADVTSPESFEEARTLSENFRRICGHAPIVFCGNKVDRRDRQVSAQSMQTNPAYRAMRPYYDLSGKSMYNQEKPFLNLLRRITGHEDLQFTN